MPTDMTPRLNMPFLAASQAQKELAHNEALVVADAVICAAVQGVGVNAPPTSPCVGQCWLAGAAPTGSWAAQAHALAVWTSGGWRFVPPFDGLQVWVVPDRVWAVYDNGAWRVGDLRAARLLVGGQQIVGSRQPVVPAPSGGAVIDVEARAAITSVIARMVAHGLINS